MSGADRQPLAGYERWSIIERSTGRTIVPHLKVADRFLLRLAGLQFRRPLPAGHGLLLTPCASVHTMCLRFPLDLAMIGDGGVVLAVRHQVRPWRGAVAPRGTRAVLEVTANTLRLTAGERVSVASEPHPRSLSFLNISADSALRSTPSPSHTVGSHS